MSGADFGFQDDPATLEISWCSQFPEEILQDMLRLSSECVCDVDEVPDHCGLTFLKHIEFRYYESLV